MNSKLIQAGIAFGAVFLMTSGASRATLPEPFHVIYGVATACGEDLEEGTLLELQKLGDPHSITRFVLDSDPNLGPLFALRAPIDSVDPQVPGTLRPGDEVEIFIRDHGIENCDELAGRAVVDVRGTFQRLDVDPDFAESLPSLTIDDVRLAEGPSGQDTEFVFTLRLSEESNDSVDVNWITDDDHASATASPGVDYIAANGLATILAGDLTATFAITVPGDDDPEPDEDFFVELVASTHSNILDPLGKGTILDDDTPPTISVNNITVTEPPFGSVEATFTVSLSHVWDETVSVDFATAPGTATAGSDYLSVSGTAEVVVGRLSTSMAVDVLFDDEDEDDETFFVDLTNPVVGTLLDDQGQGTIVDIVQFLIFQEKEQNNVGTVSGMAGPWALAVSPSGDHLYVAARASSSILLFDRDATDGQVTFVERWENGTDGVSGIGNVEALLVTDDQLYAAGFFDDSVAVFSRDDATGLLTVLEVETDGIDDQSDVGGIVEGLDGAMSLALTADSKHLYVIGFHDDAVASFERDSDDTSAGYGKLSFLEVEVDGVDDPTDLGPEVDGLLGATSVAISPDDEFLYVTGFFENEVALFDRETNAATGLLGHLTYVQIAKDGVGGVDGLGGPVSVAISPDGANLYVAAQNDDGIGVFDLMPDGTLSFVEAILDGLEADGLLGIKDVAVSFDGQVVYASGFDDDAVTPFHRDLAGGFLEQIEVKFDGVGGVDGLEGANGLAVSADDFNVYAAGVVENSIAVFSRDLSAPSDPSTIDSTSHTAGVWSSQAMIAVEWSGSIDNSGGSGVKGYSFLFDLTPTTLPDSEIDLAHTTDPHATSGIVADGRPHYFHLRTCDWSENCTSTVHLGPYWIDTSPPSDPSGLGSTSHTPGVPDNTTFEISMVWDVSTDPGADPSGVVGYAYRFDPLTSGVCDPAVDVVTTAAGVVSPTLSSGSWYFHICAVDTAGNTSLTVAEGPYLLGADLVSPQILALGSVPMPEEGGWLSPGAQTMTTPTQLLVQFSESMNDPVGDSDPADVTNPANYRLLAAGTDGILETTSCASLAGDDVLVTVDHVFYDFTLSEAAVKINGGFPLSEDSYRFLGCSALEDDWGNALDGDGNGTGGDDFLTDFEVMTTNLLLNPNLDEDEADWLASVGTPAEFAWDVRDADSIASSGSALLTNLTAPDWGLAMSQCVDVSGVVAGTRYRLGGWTEIDKTPPGVPIAKGSVIFFDDADCLGSELSSDETCVVVGDTSGEWRLLRSSGLSPEGAGSVLVSFIAVADSSPSFGFDIYFDSLEFKIPNVAIEIFFDGFGSGDTSHWCGTFP